MSAEGISAREHLTAEHDVRAFDSATPELDNWLKRRALTNAFAWCCLSKSWLSPMRRQ